MASRRGSLVRALDGCSYSVCGPTRDAIAVRPVVRADAERRPTSAQRDAFRHQMSIGVELWIVNILIAEPSRIVG